MTKLGMAWQTTDYWTWHGFVFSEENKTAQAGALCGHLQVLLILLRSGMISGLH